MQKHLLFMVHGMGIHPPGWSANAWQTLRTAYDALDRSPACTAPNRRPQLTLT